MPVLAGPSTGRQLLILAACLRGCPRRITMAQQVAEVISSGDVCQSHEVGSAEQEGANVSSTSLANFQTMFVRWFSCLMSRYRQLAVAK